MRERSEGPREAVGAPVAFLISCGVAGLLDDEILSTIKTDYKLKLIFEKLIFKKLPGLEQ